MENYVYMGIIVFLLLTLINITGSRTTKERLLNEFVFIPFSVLWPFTVAIGIIALGFKIASFLYKRLS